MEITPEHEDAAHRLTHEPETPGGTTRAIPARLGYLAAVERTEENEQALFHRGTETWSAITSGRGVAVMLENEDAVVELTLSPSAIRERAYELLVLADLAEAGA